MLKKDSNTEQMVYYQAGIGTYTDPIFNLPVSYGISLTLDTMLAWSLGSHVKEGYTYLMQNYSEGDKICIFGFSRGAYTARALAGMLHKVGLLPVCNTQQIPFAYEMYVREDAEGLQLSHMFKNTFCRPVQVEFLGVWDTVASVGFIPHYLPFIHENTGVRYLRHGLALDERRVKFMPQFCVDDPFHSRDRKPRRKVFNPRHLKRTPTITKAYEDMINQHGGLEKTDVLEVWFAGVHTDVGGGSVPNGTRHSLSRIPLRWMIRECFRCDTGIIFDAVQLQQAGFRVKMEDDKPVLGDLPPRVKLSTDTSRTVHPREHIPTKKYIEEFGLLRFLWNIAHVAFAFLIAFLKPYIRQKKTSTRLPFLYLDSHSNKLVDQTDDHEAYEELDDALSPMYDQLSAKAAWHILEWIPQRVQKTQAIIQKLQDGDSYRWLWNRGRGRRIPRSEMREGLKIHRSVKTRLEASGWMKEHYVPQVRPEIGRHADVNSGDGGAPHQRPGFHRRRLARMLRWEEWNVDEPEHWTWVD